MERLKQRVSFLTIHFSLMYPNFNSFYLGKLIREKPDKNSKRILKNPMTTYLGE